MILPIKQLSQFSRSNQDLRVAHRKIQELQERIKRLEEAVETSIRAMEFYGPTSNIANSCKLLKLEMIKAKEANP